MIQNQKLRAMVEALTKNLHNDDVIRLYDFISEIKEDEPELTEFDVVTKAFAMLIEETHASAQGMKTMAKDLRVFNDIGIPFVSKPERHGITIEEIEEAHRKR